MDILYVVLQPLFLVFLFPDPVGAVSRSTHRCEGMTPPTPDDPNPGLTACTATATPTSLSNHTFLHGDTLVCMYTYIASSYNQTYLVSGPVLNFEEHKILYTCRRKNVGHFQFISTRATVIP